MALKTHGITRWKQKTRRRWTCFWQIRLYLSISTEVCRQRANFWRVSSRLTISHPKPSPSKSTVQVYGDVAVVVGVFRIKGTEKGKPYVHRERFVDTWIKLKGTWQCVATTNTLITG